LENYYLLIYQHQIRIDNGIGTLIACAILVMEDNFSFSRRGVAAEVRIRYGQKINA